ncbi:MAG: AMP-binding protein [Candidatus Eisenbacteria bacterium]
MSLATEARRLLEKLPPGTRETLERTVSFLPRPFLYGSAFRTTQAELRAGDRMTGAALGARQDARVKDLVAWAYERVPYYRGVMDERGLKPGHVTRARDLNLLPTIDRRTLAEHGDAMVARGVPASARDFVATSGTSGTPVRLAIDRGRSAHEWAFMTGQWARVGYRPGARREVLRGVHVKGSERGRLHEWHPLLDELVLSTFLLSPATIGRYVDLLLHYRPDFLHAFPSSAEMLARLVADLPADRRPRFRALLLGSENLYPAQREHLERAFGCPVLAWYGHSEKCLLGAGCERSHDYHMIPDYGVLELVDDRGDPVGPGESGTIVGTGFLNRVMPFLRYATDDKGTLAADSAVLPADARPCACGRSYPRLSTIEGRWHGERLFGGRGEVFPMTAINTHSDAFRHVMRFCVRQDRPGEATVVVVPGPGFGPADSAAIVEAYGRSAAGAVRFMVEAVAELPLGARGKFKLVEQRIPEDVQQALIDGRGEVA